MRNDLIENIKKGYDEAGLAIEFDTSKFTSEAEYLNHLADEYLETYDNLSGLQSLHDIAKRTGIDDTALQELYAEYKDVFFDASIVFNKDLSEEELRNILAGLQATADAENIEAKIDVV
jgi:hypothetical protein